MIDKRLFKLVDSHALIAIVVARLLTLGLSILLWLTISREAAFFIRNGKLHFPIVLMFVFILVFIGKYFLTKKIESYTYQSSSDLRLTFRESVLKKSFKLGNDPHQLPATKLSQLTVEGVEQLEIYYARFLPQLFYCMLASLVIFIVLALFALKPAVTLLICMPFIPIVIMLVMKIAKKILRHYWGDYTDLGEKFHENLSGMSTLKAFHQDGRKQVEVETGAEKFRKATMALLSMQLTSITVMDIISYSGAGLGIGLALRAYAEYQLSLTGMLLFILLSAEFFIPMRQLGSLFHVAMNGISASEQLFDYLDLPEPIYGTDKLEDELSRISFEKVTFDYEDGSEIPSLTEINAVFQKGTFSAIVGKSGSGKSTMAKLLVHQADGYKGSILWNQQDLSSLSADTIKDTVMLVDNHAYLYAQSIRENLLVSSPDADDEQLWQVLKQVNLDKFVEQQSDGLATILYENGANLSGGQRQRLILARALLADKQLYIFDEITSGIDIESENQILRVIQDLAREKIVLFISHRLYNVLSANQVLVLDSGKLVAQGTPKDLRDTSKFFKEYFAEETAILDEEDILDGK